MRWFDRWIPLEAYAPVLGARLAMCVPPGGSNIELMSPALAEASLSQSLQRFQDIRHSQ